MRSLLLPTSLCFVLIAGSPAAVLAQAVAKVSQALPFATQGKVELTEAATTDGVVTNGVATTTARPAAITAGGKISTDENGSASVTLGGLGTVQMDRNTEIQIPAESDAQHSLELLKGRLILQISAEDLQKRQAGEFRLKTPASLLAVKGTRFFVECENKGDIVGLHEGSVLVLEPTSKSTTTLMPDQAVSVSPGVISATRALSKKEKSGASKYEDILTVTTPLVVATSSQFFWQGQVVDRSNPRHSVKNFSLADVEHLLFENYRYVYGSNRGKDIQMQPDGSLIWTIDYKSYWRDPTVVRKPGDLKTQLEKIYTTATNPLHFKGEVWRSKNAGLARIGMMIGVQMHLRFKNVSKMKGYTNGGGSFTLVAPNGEEAGWEKTCVFPLSPARSGENSTHRMYMTVWPHDPLDANGKIKAGTAEVSCSKVVLISNKR